MTAGQQHVLRPKSSLPGWLPAGVAAAVSLVLYAVTLGGTYVYDDDWVILQDPRISHPSQWKLFWTQQYMQDAPDNLYRPLVSMSYALQWRLHGDRAWAFHLVNWVLAAGAAAAVAELARRLVLSMGAASAPGARGGSGGGADSVSAPAGRSQRLAFVAGLAAGVLFAVHPAHVEAVAGIVGRAELACTLATFTGLCLFLRRPLSWPRIAGILACFLIALLSKEQGILFPLLLAILAWARRAGGVGGDVGGGVGGATGGSAGASAGAPAPAWSEASEGRAGPALAYRAVRDDARAEPARNKGRWLAVCLIWVESAYLYFREKILRFEWPRSWLSYEANPMVRSTGADRWLMPLELLGRYVVLTVAPYRLSIDYGASVIKPRVQYREPYFYLGCAAASLWVAWCAACLVKSFRATRRAATPDNTPRRGGSKGPEVPEGAGSEPGLAPAAAFALLGAALTLGLVLNAVELIGTVFGERLLFMPSAFLAILAGLVAARLAAVGGVQTSPPRRGAARTTAFPAAGWAARAALALLGVWALLGAVRTVTYARQWNDQWAFYQSSLARQPDSVRLHALVANHYLEAHDWTAAKRVGEDCLRVSPESWESWALCIEPEFEMGRLREAKALVKQAMALSKDQDLMGWLFKIDDALQARGEATTQAAPAGATRPAATQPAGAGAGAPPGGS